MGILEDAKAGNYKAVQQAIANGADVNQQDEQNYTALTCMAAQGNYELVRQLFDAGADPFVYCQATGKKGFVAMDFALKAQDETVKHKSNTQFAKIIMLLSPPEAIEDAERGAEELKDWLKNHKVCGTMCAGAKIKIGGNPAIGLEIIEK